MSKLLSNLASYNIKSIFSLEIYNQGMNYVVNNFIKNISIKYYSDTECKINANIINDHNYHIILHVKDTQRYINLSNTCTCYKKQDCEHVVAVLIKILTEKSSLSILHYDLPMLKFNQTDKLTIDIARESWSHKLQNVMLTKNINNANELSVSIEKIQNDILPIACLRLFQEKLQLSHVRNYYQRYDEEQSLIALTFEYNGIRIAWDNNNYTALKNIVRNKVYEAAAIKELMSTNVRLIGAQSAFAINNDQYANCFIIETIGEQNSLTFITKIIPKLQKQGWKIEIDENYPYKILQQPIDDWYSIVAEDVTKNWFDLELGITVNNKKINLLPILKKLLTQHKKIFDIDNITDQEIYVELSDNNYIALPVDRIKNILNIFIELYDTNSLNSQNELRLAKAHASRLLELENAIEAIQLRWIGSDNLYDLARKLMNFNEIKITEPPSQFLGKLRQYQQDGLNWLQFLREYGLSGILADDMGLGKTVQTIAHLILEKVSNRMNSPCLIVSPTSLMFNWQVEIKRFAPDLKILLLYGAERRNYFNDLANYDVVLTTYKLILLDKIQLLTQDFYLLILDEAQFIKNSSSKIAQITLQLKAQYRLCLTGTPMENHLGELWSLFNFIMPGLLGKKQVFNKIFRTPIEKHFNQEQKEYLNKRIAPFLLRRTKDKVLEELPEKIEIIRRVELNNEQRDLYETIRLTMQDKINHEVAQLGLSRSQIIIFDALLKLRQVCCDPRLLKISSIHKHAIKSAKLELLIELLVELLEEGRRILLFSQFTEMLQFIEQDLIIKNISYVKLIGSTKDRQTPVQQFQDHKVPLFLISLKAGGTGLNLTAADTVIHYDPWWNPAVENQATDRAHRIGQINKVFVYKLIVNGSVEEKILNMQQHKKDLMMGVFDNNIVKSMFTEEDIMSLFVPI